MQDTNKDGSLRWVLFAVFAWAVRKLMVPSCMLRHYHFKSLVNYGALPQTWEDPSHIDEDTGLAGVPSCCAHPLDRESDPGYCR